MNALLAPPTPWTEDRMAFLDRSCEELRSGGDLTEPMNRLSDGLWWFRRQSNRAEWMNWVETSALRHPIRELVHSDPFTHRSFAKPRGFAGDAGLLDLIYYDQGWVNLRGHTPVGQKIFWRNRNAPAPRAVRERRDHCAALVDRAALRKNGARVLAVACGNLREALQSSAVITRSLGEFVALDQDELALESVRATLGDRVVCRKGSVRTIVAGGLKEERFDLIYAAGLYDYLAKPLACRLTSKLFELLDPGGELLVANFTHDVADVGYMESFMAWHLIYRSPDELFDVASELPEAVRSTSVTYQLESPDIAYLRLMKT